MKQKDRYVPQFAKDVAALDQKEVKLQGFMMPLEMGDKQTHFVLAAMPQTLRVLPAGRPGEHGRGEDQDAGEVHLRSGRRAAASSTVLKDDPTGVFYRITDAVHAN